MKVAGVANRDAVECGSDQSIGLTRDDYGGVMQTPAVILTPGGAHGAFDISDDAAEHIKYLEAGTLSGYK